MQRSINKAALAVLRCTQQLYDWGQGAAGPNATEVALPASPVSDVPDFGQR